MINSELRPPVRSQSAATNADRRRSAIATTGFALSLLFAVAIISGLFG